jgi:acyl-CoA thioesterase I
MAQILCFGDSLTYGMWDSQGGWVNRIRKEIDKEIIKSKYLIWHEIFNLGISGNFTRDLIKRLKIELPARLLIERDPVIVVQIGINDTKYGQRTSESIPAMYRKQLEQIYKFTSPYTKHVIFIGLTAVDEEIFGTKRWLDEKAAFSNSRIQEFDAVLLEFCKQNRVDYVPLFYEFFKNAKQLLADGIHPNDRGHQLIASLVQPVVQRQLDQLG